MKSSMAITKSAAFRFMLLLHLFLKVKMCVGFVDALAAGDSDINYEDSDEWLRDVSGGRLAAWVTSRPTTTTTTTSRPVPSNLMRWEEPTGGHAARYRMHHVRHEQHYLKHRPNKPVPNVGESTIVSLDPEAHTGTGSQQPGQKSRHHNNHHNHHSHHHNSYHHVQHLASKQAGQIAGASDEEEVSLMKLSPQDAVRRTASHPFERRTLYEKRHFNDVWDSLSEGNREVQDRQVAINRKRSASSYHSLTSNALTGDGSSKSASDRTTKTSQQSVNPRSKNYFEELLNNYKSSSPYYKELHHQARSPQTKALLPPGKRNQRSSAEATKSVSKSKAPQAARTDDDLDYLYDDETDDSVQNDAPSGGAMSTSTRAPSSTTTTTTTTTTSTTTARSIESLADSDESNDAGAAGAAASEADTSYSSYYQKAYAMHSNPRRNGNNRYNSIGTRPQPSVQQQQQQQHLPSHNKRLQSDRIDPAKQVSFPGRYASVTDYKQVNFGTKDAVERSYSAYNNIQNARREAMNHLDRMHTEGRCQVPRPKIVPASNDRTKIFTPHCTILHRCEDDTGCCMPPLTCAPKSTAEVKLFFYVKNVGPRQQNTVTTLTFTNHTECHCVQLDWVSADSRPQVQNSLEQNSAEGSGGSSGATSRVSNSCTCPRHYKSVFDNESQCYCDCLSSDRDCIRFKEGFENFSMETRKCIRSKKCNVPHCEYGMYNRHEGRCPKKSDRMNEHFPQYR